MSYKKYFTWEEVTKYSLLQVEFLIQSKDIIDFETLISGFTLSYAKALLKEDKLHFNQETEKYEIPYKQVLTLSNEIFNSFKEI